MQGRIDNQLRPERRIQGPRSRISYLRIIVGCGMLGALLAVWKGAPERSLASAGAREVGGKTIRRFEDLGPKNQKFVKENYRELLSAHERKDFAAMADYARNILSLLDDYNDTKSYEAIAKRGLEQMEEERRRKRLEERMAGIRADVAALEARGEAIFERALKDPKARPELDSVIQEIYAKDPNNHKAAEWKRRIKEILAEEKSTGDRKELAELEIRGAALVKDAVTNADKRAELYRIMDRIRAINPGDTFPDEWDRQLHGTR